MQLVEFQTGRRRFGVEAGRLAAVLPVQRLRRSGNESPPWAGWLEHGGTPWPVLDAGAWWFGQATTPSAETRILMPEVGGPAGTGPWPCLLVERVWGVRRCRPEDFLSEAYAAEFGGIRCPTRLDDRGLLHWLPADLLWRQSRAMALAGGALVRPAGSSGLPWKDQSASAGMAEPAPVHVANRPGPSEARRWMRECWQLAGSWGDGTCAELSHVCHCSDCEVFRQAARQVRVSGETGDGMLEELRLPVDRPARAPDRRGLLLFDVDDRVWAVEAARVLEVTGPLPFHRLPRARNSRLCGLVQWRGSVLACFSLRRWLGLADPWVQSGGSVGPRTIILDLEESPWAWPVDQVLGVEKISGHGLARIPWVRSSQADHLARLMFRWRGSWVSLLEWEAVCRLGRVNESEPYDRQPR